MNRSINNGGSVLILVLWVVIFLSVTAVVLNQQTQLSLAFVEQHIRNSKAKALAWAGIISALDRLREDAASPRTKEADTLAECGIDAQDTNTSKIFRNVVLGDGVFNIFYKQGDGSYDGIQDEERKIDLNALTVHNENILASLIELMGFDEQRARIVAASVVDWRDSDHDLTDDPFGAEDDFYMKLVRPYHVKNADFESLEELLLIRGVTQDLFAKIKDYLTVYPKPANRLIVNFETASLPVLQAIGRSFIGGYARLTADDADSIAQKIVNFRRGDDGIEATGDDRRLDLAALGLTATQNILYQRILSYKTVQSSYFSIFSHGTFKTSTVNLKAVIRRQDLAIMSWRIMGEQI